MRIPAPTATSPTSRRWGTLGCRRQRPGPIPHLAAPGRWSRCAGSAVAPCRGSETGPGCRTKLLARSIEIGHASGLESRLVTTSNSWGDERRNLSHQLQVRGQILGRRQARRLSRRFACVGVQTPPRRLQQLLAGAPAAESELTDINFAIIATQFHRDQRAARVKRLRRRGSRSLMFAGLLLVVLNFLFCLAYLFVDLTQQATPL